MYIYNCNTCPRRKVIEWVIHSDNVSTAESFDATCFTIIVAEVNQILSFSFNRHVKVSKKLRTFFFQHWLNILSLSNMAFIYVHKTDKGLFKWKLLTFRDIIDSFKIILNWNAIKTRLIYSINWYLYALKKMRKQHFSTW